VKSSPLAGLLAEYDALYLALEADLWRREAGLRPDRSDLRRLQRWQFLAAEASGVVFAPWAARGGWTVEERR